MAVLQRVNWTENERVDLADFQNIESFVCADFSEYFKNFTNGTSLIVKGFKVFQDSALTNPLPTGSPVYVEISNSVIIHSSRDSDPIFFVGSSDTAPQSIAITSSATNYIELDLTTSLGAEDDRAIWDPTANDNEGAEFIQSVDTVQNIDAVITVNTSGFTGGNKIPIAEIEVHEDGTILSLYDRRNMYFRLATGSPYDGDHQYTFQEGRYEAIHTVSLPSSNTGHLHIQSTPSTTWTMVHNLGEQYVSFTFYDENDEVIIPNTVNATSTSTLTATFSVAAIGKCIITIGSAPNYYLHTQGSTNTTWTISHSLANKYCNVRCYDASNNYVIPQTIVATDANTITVTFASPIAGHAFVTKAGENDGFAVVNQAVSATTWTITHSLNTFIVDVTVYDSSDEVFIPDNIVVIDQNTIQITLLSADTGNVAVGEGGGGSYTVGETVIGVNSGTTATVVTSGTNSITIQGKSDPTFEVGELLNGLSSGASNEIVTIKESFVTSDKSIRTLKEMLDALMTELMRIKFGPNSVDKFWFQDAGIGIEQASLRVFGAISNPSGVPSVLNGRGIASIAYVATGQVRLNFETPMPSVDYTVTCSLANSLGFITPSTKNVNYVIISTYNTGSSLADRSFDFMIQYDD